jgi:hypothetical protein
VAFAAGIAVASQWLSMASETSTETAKLVRDVRDRIANRHDLREMRELSYRRERAASKAFRLGAEWSAWERATSEVLDALGSEVVVLKCSWRRSPDGRRVYAYPVVGVPIPPRAAESAPAGFLDALKRQVQDLGLREPKVLDRRSVDVLSAEAPVSSAPTTDLYWLELEVPFEPGGAVK